MSYFSDLFLALFEIISAIRTVLDFIATGNRFF